MKFASAGQLGPVSLLAQSARSDPDARTLADWILAVAK